MNLTDYQLKPLEIRKRLGREDWAAPVKLGPDAWGFTAKNGDGTILVSWGPWEESGQGEGVWVHASMTRAGRTPSYEDLCLLHRAVFDGTVAYQVFVPPDQHINIHEHALHLWGPGDGVDRLPRFGEFGTI